MLSEPTGKKSYALINLPGRIQSTRILWDKPLAKVGKEEDKSLFRLTYYDGAKKRMIPLKALSMSFCDILEEQHQSFRFKK